MIHGLTSVVLMAAFCGASFFFALSETALFALGAWRIRLMAEKDARGALVQGLMERRDDLLATIVLGNTLANAGVVAIGLGAVYHRLWPISPLPATGLLLTLILLGCEVVPKTLGVRLPEFWSMRVAAPMVLLVRWSGPLRRIAQALNTGLMAAMIPKSIQRMGPLSEAEFEELLQMGLESGSLKRAEKVIIEELLRFGHRTVREAMRPRSRVDMVDDDLSLDEMRSEARRLKHRRLPIYDEASQTVIGVLNTRLLLSDPEIGLDEAMEFPSFVPESMNLLMLWKSLRRQNRGMAIVLDEFGSMAGIVTIEDILESVVGQIRGEGEAQEVMVERLGEGAWRVNGLLRLDDFERECPAVGGVAEVETVGGLFLTQFGFIPSPGDSVVFRGLRLTVTAADNRRVRELSVETLRKA